MEEELRKQSLDPYQQLGMSRDVNRVRIWASFVFTECVSRERAFGVFEERADWIVEKVSEA